MHSDLLKLPIFTVDEVSSDGDAFTLRGTFNYFSDFCIANGLNGVSYLYDPPNFYTGNLVSFDKNLLSATFQTQVSAESKTKSNDQFAWLYGYYQPYHLNFILDKSRWRKKNYDDPVDHDHCLICSRHICAQIDCKQYDSSQSYCCEKAGWLCAECFEKYVKVNSLGFLLDRKSTRLNSSH